MKEFFKKIKGFIFIYLALVLILGLGLNFLSFSAKAQEFHLDIETQRWENATTHKFRDNAILENKICNTGENAYTCKHTSNCSLDTKNITIKS